MRMGKGVGLLAAEAVTDRVAERVESPLAGVVGGRMDEGMGMAAVTVQRLCNLCEAVHLLEHVLHALSVPHGVEVRSTDACVVVVVGVVMGVEGVVEHGE